MIPFTENGRLYSLSIEAVRAWGRSEDVLEEWLAHRFGRWEPNSGVRARERRALMLASMGPADARLSL